MVNNDFLEQLKIFTETTLSDMLLPVRRQDQEEEVETRPPAVYRMRLPDSTSARKKAPYVIHQLIATADAQKDGEDNKSTSTVRSIICVYCDDEEEGGLMLVELMDRLRIAILKQIVIAERYKLDTESGIETLCYPDDTAPYFCGEMMSTWLMPAVQREVRQWL